MRNIYLKLTTIFFFLITLSAYSQDLKPCGTLDYKSAWLEKFQQNPSNLARNTDTLKYLPLSIHIVGSNNGTGYFSISRLMDALCTLNTDFSSTNIQFYIDGDIHYIDSTGWYVHETVLEGADMMFANNIENTINCYFVSNPAGNCGYNLPYAGIAIAKNCAFVTDHTWAHEMGHNLSLPHPFLGWEGDLYDYSVPTPTTVTYDYTYFKDTLIIDTLIIDTTFVELVDGSNCLIAADGFCDTAPDYISYRWNCNANDASPFILKDPNEEDFYVDGTLFMSYSDDGCQSRFSDDQICAMHATITDLKPELMQGVTPDTYDNSALTLFSPANNSIVAQNEVTLTWSSKENSNGYYVRVSRTPNMSVLKYSGFVQDTSVIVPNLQINKLHYWQVIPFNKFNGCYEAPTVNIFTVGLPTSNQIIGFDQNELNLQNTLLKQYEPLIIQSHLNNTSILNLDIVNIKGQSVYNKDLNLSNAAQITRINHKLIPGQYFILLSSSSKRYMQSFVVQQ